MPELKIFNQPLNNTSPALTALSALPVLQPCILRPNRILNMSRGSNEEAYLGQERGQSAAIACLRCSREGGPFIGCKVVANLFGGSCCNCQWNGMAARCSFRETIDSPAPPSPLPGPITLGLSSQTFNEVQQSLNDLLDNPPPTKDQKRYDRWLNVDLTRTVRELMVKTIERTIGRALVPASNINSVNGTIRPQFNDSHAPNYFEWHFTPNYTKFPSKDIENWNHAEVVDFKKALENYDVYPYDLEQEAELPREQKRLLGLARASFKNHICNVIDPIAIKSKTETSTVDVTGERVGDLQTAFVGNGSMKFPGREWRYKGAVQNLLERPLLWKWTAEELRCTLDAISDRSLRLAHSSQLAVSKSTQKPRATQSSSVDDASRHLSADIQSIIHAHFHDERPSGKRHRFHRRRIIDEDETEDEYNEDEDAEGEVTSHAASHIVSSDLITFTPKAIELMESGKKLSGYIRREEELKKSVAEHQDRIHKLEKNVENIPRYLRQIEELESLRDSQAATLQEQAERAKLAAQTASTKLESVELNNMLLLEQIKKLNKDLEAVKERAADRKAELKRRIQALEKALTDEMAVSKTGASPARTQPFTARRSHPLTHSTSRSEDFRPNKDATPNRSSGSIVTGGRSTGNENEERNNITHNAKRISTTASDMEILSNRRISEGSSLKAVKREAPEEAAPRIHPKRRRPSHP